MPIDGLQPSIQITRMQTDSEPGKSTDGILPRAHVGMNVVMTFETILFFLYIFQTCFNQIVLPQYSSRDILEDRLWFALINTDQGFFMS